MIMDNKFEMKAEKYVYCDRCNKMICPGEEMIVEKDKQGDIVATYCGSCGKGHPVGTLIY